MAQFVLNITTTDAYQQLNCFGSRKLTLQVSNAGIAIGFGSGGGSQPLWDFQDEPYLPVVGSIVRAFDAIRIKSLVPGKPAVVMAIATPG
jgi:hypothetical protein